MVERPKSDLAVLCGYAPNYDFPGQRFLRGSDVDKVMVEFGIEPALLQERAEEATEERIGRLMTSRVTPVEKFTTRTVPRTTNASESLTQRVEAVLVELYQRVLSTEKFSALRVDGLALRADLYREAGDEVEIIEAKSSATHRKVREAVAQLLDYAVYSPRPVTTLTALFPELPGEHSLDLLHRVGIDCVSLADDGSFARLPASPAQRRRMLPVWRGC
ncbi:hypothetical protein [Actinokineospora terrae]|uniref:Uncharacterized protein n=1 Tax=Actinokineospora terrae TaxID=155974 RepID=A0A1H9W0Y6_9PSEU|nr:hypothetical protein [Actinokineospora terrae]SES27183.1 hypothetical protein SAMN04487818_109229 [Actinokineospora terrae]